MVVNVPLLRVGVVEVWQRDVLCSFLTEMIDWVGSFEQAENFGRIEGELELVEVETERAGGVDDGDEDGRTTVEDQS